MPTSLHLHLHLRLGLGLNLSLSLRLRDGEIATAPYVAVVASSGLQLGLNCVQVSK